MVTGHSSGKVALPGVGGGLGLGNRRRGSVVDARAALSLTLWHRCHQGWVQVVGISNARCKPAQLPSCLSWENSVAITRVAPTLLLP
jgi:hypothetical protein